MSGSLSLKQSVLSAVGWATATRFLAQMATWAMTLATVRFLSPADYGLMAVTMTISAFVSSLSTVGLIDAVVQSRRITDDDLDSVFGLVLLINGGCLVLLCALAYPLAWFYRDPRLVPLLQVSSLLFVAAAFEAVPRSELNKRLDLKSLSRIELVARIAAGGMVLFLAWAGFGVWALLIGPLLAAALRALGCGIAVGRLRRPRLRFANLSEVLRFGGLRTVEQILYNVYTNSDVFIIGRLLGADLVGIYYVARNLAAMPVDKFALTVKPAAFPAFALVQHDRAGSLRYLQKAMRLLAFVCFPALFGLAATAPQAVGLALGPNWTKAATPVALIAIAMAFRPVGLVIGPFLMGLGEFAASFRNSLFAVFLFPAAFFAGSHWGLTGVCAAWIVASPVQLIVLIRRAALVSRAPITGLVTPLLPPLAGAVVMYLAVKGVAGLLPGGWHLWPSFLALVATGILVYFAYAALLLRSTVGEFRDLFRR